MHSFQQSGTEPETSVPPLSLLPPILFPPTLKKKNRRTRFKSESDRPSLFLRSVSPPTLSLSSSSFFLDFTNGPGSRRSRSVFLCLWEGLGSGRPVRGHAFNLRPIYRVSRREREEAPKKGGGRRKTVQPRGGGAKSMEKKEGAFGGGNPLLPLSSSSPFLFAQL